MAVLRSVLSFLLAILAVAASPVALPLQGSAEVTLSLGTPSPLVLLSSRLPNGAAVSLMALSTATGSAVGAGVVNMTASIIAADSSELIAPSVTSTDGTLAMSATSTAEVTEAGTLLRVELSALGGAALPLGVTVRADIAGVLPLGGLTLPLVIPASGVAYLRLAVPQRTALTSLLRLTVESEDEFEVMTTRASFSPSFFSGGAQTNVLTSQGVSTTGLEFPPVTAPAAPTAYDLFGSLSIELAATAGLPVTVSAAFAVASDVLSTHARYFVFSADDSGDSGDEQPLQRSLSLRLSNADIIQAQLSIAGLSSSGAFNNRVASLTATANNGKTTVNELALSTAGGVDSVGTVAPAFYSAAASGEATFAAELQVSAAGLYALELRSTRASSQRRLLQTGGGVADAVVSPTAPLAVSTRLYQLPLAEMDATQQLTLRVANGQDASRYTVRLTASFLPALLYNEEEGLLNTMAVATLQRPANGHDSDQPVATLAVTTSNMPAGTLYIAVHAQLPEKAKGDALPVITYQLDVAQETSAAEQSLPVGTALIDSLPRLASRTYATELPADTDITVVMTGSPFAVDAPLLPATLQGFYPAVERNVLSAATTTAAFEDALLLRLHTPPAYEASQAPPFPFTLSVQCESEQSPPATPQANSTCQFNLLVVTGRVGKGGDYKQLPATPPPTGSTPVEVIAIVLAAIAFVSWVAFVFWYNGRGGGAHGKHVPLGDGAELSAIGDAAKSGALHDEDDDDDFDNEGGYVPPVISTRSASAPAKSSLLMMEDDAGEYVAV